MAVVEQHTSADGLLKLYVDLSGGDWTVGFDGMPDHTHGDILAATEYPGTPDAAVRSYVDDILASRRLIVILRIGQRIKDVVVPDGPDRDYTRRLATGETVEKRFWNGSL